MLVTKSIPTLSLQKRCNLYIVIISCLLFTIFLNGCEVAKSKEIVSPQPNNSQIPKELADDPVYQEWLEIDQRTSPFKKDLRWNIDSLEYLLDKNRKWKVVKDDEMMSKIKYLESLEAGKVRFSNDKKENKKAIWEKRVPSIEDNLNHYKNLFKNKIIKEGLFRKAATLSIPLEQFDIFIKKAGFQKQLKKEGLMSYWTDISYWQELEIYKGEQKGKGQVFSVTLDSNGRVVQVVIPLGQAKVDWLNLPSDQTQTNNMFRKLMPPLFSALPSWVKPSLDLVFGTQSETVYKKLKEIGSSKDNELDKMNNRKKQSDGLYGENNEVFDWQTV